MRNILLMLCHIQSKRIFLFFFKFYRSKPDHFYTDPVRADPSERSTYVLD